MANGITLQRIWKAKEPEKIIDISGSLLVGKRLII